MSRIVLVAAMIASLLAIGKREHVKVQAPHEAVLTTQLFFPGVARNASDGIFTSECLVKRWRLAEGRRLATFDFVVDI